MHKLLSLFALAGLSAPALAQINVAQHDGSTDFTSRGIAGNVDGWAHNGYKVDRQGGGIGTGLAGWATIMQDQNCSTLENFQFAIFGGGADRNTGLPIPGSFGAPNTWPDVNNVIGATAVFTSPAGQPVTPCAWIYTTTFVSPVDTSTLADLFSSTLLVSNLGWVADGASSHISINQAAAGSASREYPITSGNAATNIEMTNEFGINWVGLGPASGGSVANAGTKRFWVNPLRYMHTSRSGAEDTSGQYGVIFGALGPQNFGMAGDFPDASNITGQPLATPRGDEIIWSDQHALDFAAGTGFGQVLLSTTLLRSIILAPLPLVGTGLLELDPSDPLFNFGSLIPGMVQTIVNIGTPTIYDPLVPLTQIAGIAPILHINQIDLYAQVVRIDLVSGTASLGSLDTHSFRQ